MNPKIIIKSIFNEIKIGFLFLFLTFILLFPLIGSADIGNENYKKGKSAYDAGRFQEAIGYFQKCIVENEANYGGKGNYMIALSYIKMGKCNLTKAYFKAAIKADPEKGGASTKEKFTAKLKECQLRMSDLAMANAPVEEYTDGSGNENANDTPANLKNKMPFARPDSILNAYSTQNANEYNSNAPPQSARNESKLQGILIWGGILAFVLVVVYFVVRYLNNQKGTNLKGGTGNNANSNANSNVRNGSGKLNSGGYPSNSGRTHSGYQRSHHSDMSGNRVGNQIGNIANSVLNAIQNVAQSSGRSSGSSHVSNFHRTGHSSYSESHNENRDQS